MTPLHRFFRALFIGCIALAIILTYVSRMPGAGTMAIATLFISLFSLQLLAIGFAVARTNGRLAYWGAVIFFFLAAFNFLAPTLAR
jgi:hypothetical protein